MLCTAFVEMDPVVTSFKDRRKVQLSSLSDPLYGRIRDLNFSVVGRLLNQTARKLNEDYDERHSAKTVSQLKDFVGKLSSIQQEHQALKLRMTRFSF
jgi:hypothetical protein